MATLQELVIKANEQGVKLTSENVQEFAKQVEQKEPEEVVSQPTPVETYRPPRNLEEAVKIAQDAGLSTSEQDIIAVTEQVTKGVNPQKVVSHQEWQEIKQVAAPIKPPTLKETVKIAQEQGFDTSQQTIQAISEQKSLGVERPVDLEQWTRIKQDAKATDVKPEELLGFYRLGEELEVEREKVKKRIEVIEEYKDKDDKYNIFDMILNKSVSKNDIIEFFGEDAYNENVKLVRDYNSELKKFDIEHSLNPLDDSYYKNEDLSDYVMKIVNGIPQVDWARFNQDKSNYELSKLIEEIGTSKAIAKFEKSDNKHDNLAVGILKKQQDIQAKYSQNPIDKEFYKNEDLNPYVMKVVNGIPQIDWGKFNQDRANNEFYNLVGKIGLSEAINQTEKKSDLTIHDEAAIAKFKDMVQDPKTKEFYNRDWYKGFEENDIMPKTEAKRLFGSGGMEAVLEVANPRMGIWFNSREEAVDDLFNKEKYIHGFRGNLVPDVLQDKLESLKENDRDEYNRINGRKLATGYIKQSDIDKIKDPVLKELVELRARIDYKARDLDKGNTKFSREVWASLSTEVQDLILKERSNEVRAEKNNVLEYMVPVWGTYLTARERGMGSGWTWLSAGLDATIVLSAAGIPIKTAAATALKPVRAYGKLTGFEELAVESMKATTTITKGMAKTTNRIDKITRANVARNNIKAAVINYSTKVTEGTALAPANLRAGSQELKDLYRKSMGNLRAHQEQYINELKEYDTTVMRRNQLLKDIRARQEVNKELLSVEDLGKLNTVQELDQYLDVLRNRINVTGMNLNKVGKEYGRLIVEGTGLDPKNIDKLVKLSKTNLNNFTVKARKLGLDIVNNKTFSPAEWRNFFRKIGDLGLAGKTKLSDVISFSYSDIRKQIMNIHKNQRGSIGGNVTDRYEANVISKAKPKATTKTAPKAPTKSPITEEEFQQLLRDGLTEDDILRAIEKSGGDRKLFWDEIHKIKRLYLAVKHTLDKPLTKQEDDLVKKMLDESEKWSAKEKQKKIEEAIKSIKPKKRPYKPRPRELEETDVIWSVAVQYLTSPKTITKPSVEVDPRVKPYPLPSPYPKEQPQPQPSPMVAPSVQPQVKPMPLPQPKPQPEVKPEPKPKPEAKPKPKTKTQPEVKPKPEPKPAPEPKPKPELKPEPKIKPDSDIKVASKTGLKPKIIPNFTKNKKGEIIGFPIGSIAWKQGKLAGKPHYKVIKPPYNSNEDIISYLGYPQGVIVVKNAKKASETIQSISAPMSKKKLTIDMGIMDIVIKKTKRDKPSIKFKRDIKQKTKSDLTAKEVTVSRGK